MPSIAVQRGPGNSIVDVIKPDNTAALTPVKIGQDDGQTAIITSGVEGWYACGGQWPMSRLQNGARVVPTQAQAGQLIALPAHLFRTKRETRP
jgi:multidrug efflux system membrane fusion protein